MTYTINANAKNVWIRDNEDTMDLSPITDASSVYLENGRTLEQELGEGSMVSNVTTVDGAMSKVIDGTYDGAYESLVFKGKSLINLMTSCKDEYVVRYHDPSNPKNTVANISMMKPNTEYTLFYKAKYRLEGEGAGESGTLLIATSVEQGFIGTSQNLTTEYKQYVFKLTTTSTVDCFTFKSNGKYFAIKECVLLEGDYTNQDIPFFEGICDVKMPILRNVGKNLLTREYALNGATLVEETNEYVMTKGSGNIAGGLVFAPNLIPNKTYSFSVTAKTNRTADGAIRVYNDTRKEYINVYLAGLTTQAQKVGGVFTVPSTHQMGDEFKIWIGKNTDYDLETTFTIYKDWQLEESSSITTHEDHKSNILRTSEEIVLREVDGVQDTYNGLTGEYVKRIEECVLDGSQALSLDGSLVYLELTDRPFNNSGIADKVPVITVNQLVAGEFGICMQDRGTSGRIYINIEGLTTREEILQYLRTNPITIHYRLVEPVATIVKPSTIPFAYQNGHIILESGSEEQSLLPTLEYSTVVNRIGQVESVAKVIQKQEKQLTMLEQMLIQNIIELDYNNTVLALNLEINEVI